MVAYERWMLTRGSKYSDLTWKLFGKTGRLREVVATGGLTVGSHYFSKYVGNRSFEMIVIYENTVIAFYIIYCSKYSVCGTCVTCMLQFFLYCGSFVYPSILECSDTCKKVIRNLFF